MVDHGPTGGQNRRSTTFLREPLLHFVLLGAAVFALFGLTNDSPLPAPADQLVISDADAARLVSQFEAVWRRQPSAQELNGLIDSYFREEVLVREALALGLDRDDAVVRQRLAMKMTFLIESGAEAVEATVESLTDHLAANEARFIRQGRVAFEQILIDPEIPVETVRTALRAGEDHQPFATASLLPSKLPVSTQPTVDGTFGRGFFDTVIALEPGRWTGPVESAFGLHLVRVLSFEPPRVPPLDEIRDAVEQDWRATVREDLANSRIEALQSRYDVVRPDPATVLAQ